MAYRIVRSPSRKVFYVDVGNIPPTDVEQFMQRFMTSMKRNQVIDPTSGQVDLRYNPMSVEEDYYIPVRGGVQTKIEQIGSDSNTNDIEDVKYLRDKLFSGLKVPQAYLTYGEGKTEDKGTLAQKDIRFARTIDRLQRCVLSELEKIATVHLYVLGFRNEDLLNFKLKLNNPSKIAEMQELEHWKTKFDAVASVPEGYFSKRWVAHNIFEISDEEYQRNQRELFYDKQVAAELEGAGAAPDAAMGGGAMPGMGDMGEEPDLGAEMGGEELGGEEMGAEAAAPAEEPGGLIASPAEAPPEAPAEAPLGKRDDKRKLRWTRPKKYLDTKTGDTTTSKSKGKVYSPEKVDNRPQGARKRSWTALGSHEMARMPKRQVFGDLSMGAKELLGLGKGIFEEKNTNYDDEERKLFETKESVKKLFEDLEQLNDE